MSKLTAKPVDNGGFPWMTVDIRLASGADGRHRWMAKDKECRRGDSTCVVRWCSPVSFLCLKYACSVRCVFCIFADVRRRCCMGCCTAFYCTAVFEKRKEARIRRSLPEVKSGLLCRSLSFVFVRVVLAEQFADVRRWLLSIRTSANCSASTTRTKPNHTQRHTNPPFPPANHP